ncbi:DNA primase [Candidatus Gracilibacteria bacterium]|nr:DNA primase [Candidatus Gracilibacteria bacterium]
MSFVDDLEQSIDIVDLVGRYTRLKKAGASYKAHCPFPGHSEKTPSFVVSPVKQIAYCFGCHRGGGPVKFIMDMEATEFREAVQILGNITGREIQGFTESKEVIQIKKNLYSLYKDASVYYQKSLKENPEIKKYLMDRGLSEDDIINFAFGYADSGVSLYNYLKDKGYQDEQIEQSHIFLDIRQKKDKFIGRVIFPIENLRGDTVAFAGRIIGSGEPKYLNSPASDIYDKSSILYGLYKARKAISTSDQIIVTEGYMDTIALHRYNFLQTVAVSGTALTEKHITIIKRLTHKIYLCFDNDKAGEQATKLSLELLKNKGLEVKIIEISGAKDPDEFLEGGGNFQILIDSAITPIQYLIQKTSYNLESIDEKKKFLSEIFETISSYSDSIEQDMYLQEISKLSKTPLALIYEMYKKRGNTQKEVAEKAPKIQLSTDEILLSFVYDNYDAAEIVTNGLLFPEAKSSVLESALENPEKFFSSLDLQKKETLKALNFQNSQKYTNPEDMLGALHSAILQVNRIFYKQLTEKYKQKINQGDSQALVKYSELLQTAKKHNLK